MHLRELDGYTLQVLPGALNRGMMNGERRLLEISEQEGIRSASTSVDVSPSCG